MFLSIFSILFLLLCIYYGILIAFDLYNQKMQAQTEANSKEEMEIDISQEASEFTPMEIQREESKIKIGNAEHEEEITVELIDEDTESSQKEIEENSLNNEYNIKNGLKSFLNEDTETLIQTLGRIPDDYIKPTGETSSSEETNPRLRLRRRIVSDSGIEVTDLIEEVEKFSQKGESDLGNIIYECHKSA